MTRRASAWLVAFEHGDRHVTTCQVVGNRRPDNAGADDYDM